MSRPLQWPAILSRALLCLALLPLGACSPFNYVGSDSPRPLSVALPIHPRPKIAVVLGSGGPRGYAHIGIIKVLEANGIAPDLIVGSSVGALIGAFWASGLSASELEALSQASH
jgi:NTE family protein